MNETKVIEQVKEAIKLRKKIQEMMYDFGISTKYCYDDSNPYYNQLDEEVGGIEVEYYYGTIDKIYTPIGYINITSSFVCWYRGDQKGFEEELKKQFGLKEIEPGVQESIGFIGGWYQIGDIVPQLRKYRSEYIEYNECEEIYKRCIKELESEGFKVEIDREVKM